MNLPFVIFCKQKTLSVFVFSPDAKATNLNLPFVIFCKQKTLSVFVFSLRESREPELTSRDFLQAENTVGVCVFAARKPRT
jgi:hypothetical protein